jgi:hypothetical protein
MPIVLAIQEAEPIKKIAGCGGVQLSSQLYKRHDLKDCNLPRHKCETHWKNT